MLITGFAKFLGIASAENVLLQRDTGCDQCVQVIGAIFESKDRLEGTLIGAMENTCSLLPMDTTQCKNYIDVYANQVLQIFLNNYTPAQICEGVGLC